MDGLQIQMESIFPSIQKFTPKITPFSVYEIFQYEGEPMDGKSHEDIQPNSLTTWLNNPASHYDQQNGTATVFLQILRLDREPDNSLPIGEDLFKEIFSSHGLDPFILYLVAHESHGRYHSRSASGQQAHCIESFYVNSVSAMLLWSFNTASQETFAIIIPRSSNSVDKINEIYDKFLNTLGQQKALVKYPWFLHLVSVIEQVLWLDTVLGFELKHIRHIEQRTRHGSWNSTENPPSLPELTWISEKIGFTNAALANASRQADLMLNLLTVEGLAPSEQDSDRWKINTDPNQSEEEKAKEAAILLRTQITIRKGDISYLQKRAENQSSVIFSLISQKDTEANLEIAKSAKTDSSAMKIIAVMTMLFLPGTFFATLFAVPTLRWDQNPVVSDRFWVYLVFTLPSTLLILILYKGWKNVIVYGLGLDKLGKIYHEWSQKRGSAFKF
ncbi:hypothetical protein GGR51DRAFT_169363 [Nemania sp. FL0031]|nr:hypothetical protein GGR51DRAFT_169363 [Nemania sp. FL0031]